MAFFAPQIVNLVWNFKVNSISDFDDWRIKIMAILMVH